MARNDNIIMKWLSVKEIASASGVPERTIRFYIAEGRINARKEGRAWQCDTRSLSKAGIEINENKGKTSASPTAVPAKMATPSAKSEKKTAQRKKNKKRRYQTLEDLGVYKDLLAMWVDHPLKEMDEVYVLVKHTMEQVALGFYEFHPPRKVTFFRAAREGVVKAIVAFTILKKPKSHDAVWINGLENDILPGIIGLIRMAERRENGK